MKNLVAMLLMMLPMMKEETVSQLPTSIYDYTVTTIDGKELSMKEFKGKKIMIVNTASKCGFTPQYALLEEIYQEYGGDRFVIIGFPANNFLSQEPGTNEQIKEFCQSRYQVTFPMMAKISVKGRDMAPIYHWLTEKKLNGAMDSSVSWNFQKYLIDEQGHLVSVVPPKESPDSELILNWLKN